MGKKRLYHDNYIEFGFTYIESPNELPKPVCVLCGQSLANDSMTPSKLKRHLIAKHSKYIDEPREFFITKLNEYHQGKLASPSNDLDKYRLSHDNHLSLMMESLVADDLFMDVTLTAEGKTIKAHKCVMSAVSPYFKTLLMENPCQHPIIIMPMDIKFEELKNIIHYMYRGELTIAMKDLQSLLKTAEVLQINGLNSLDTSSSGMSGGTESETSFEELEKQWFKSEPLTLPQEVIYSPKDPLALLNLEMGDVKEENITVEQDEMETSSSEFSKIQEKIQYKKRKNCVKLEKNHHKPRHEPFSGLTSDQSVSGLNSNQILSGLTSNHILSGLTSNEALSGFIKAMDSDSELLKAFGDNVSLPSTSFMDIGKSDKICPYCDKRNFHIVELKLHLKLKHPTKPAFLCICGQVFKRQILLLWHQKTCSE